MIEKEYVKIPMDRIAVLIGPDGKTMAQIEELTKTILASDILIDEDLQNHQVKIDDITFYDHNCRGCRLVFHRVGDLMIITATTERNIDLLKFIPGHRAI